MDTFVRSLDPTHYPTCKACRQPVERLWAFAKAPGITPQGTRPERNTDRPTLPTVNVKAIAAETQAEVEQKWLRYADPTIAEQHVAREINERAGIADAAGNEIPVPTPAPLTFANPLSTEMTHS